MVWRGCSPGMGPVVAAWLLGASLACGGHVTRGSGGDGGSGARNNEPPVIAPSGPRGGSPDPGPGPGTGASFGTGGKVSFGGVAGIGGSPTGGIGIIDGGTGFGAAGGTTFGGSASAGTGAGGAPAPPAQALADVPGCGRIDLAAFGGQIYFAARDAAMVGWVDLDGLSSTSFSVTANPTQVAADADGVYWLQANGGAAADPRSSGVFLWSRQNGEAFHQLTPVGTEPIVAMTVADGYLFYAAAHDVHAVSTNPFDQRVDVVVGTATNYDLEPPAPSGKPTGLAVSGSVVAWSTQERYGIERDNISEGNGAYVELAESQASLLFPDLAIDGNHVYWAAGERVLRSQLSVKTPEQVTASPNFNVILAFDVDARRVVFATDDGRILAAEAAPPDSTPRELASGQSAPTSLVIHEGRAIWATEDCSIRSVALEQ